MYAVLDIESTGGKYNEEGIMEIAIHKFDGHEVVDTFISLINPERDIQPFVVNLTGINNTMLKTAPKFHEVAKRIVEITQDTVLVAHNAQFDYRILRTEFRRLGFDFQRKTLCTVDLSKQLIPDAESHSLGKLVRSLGIPVSDRHRANGDALATLKLFQLLLNKDTSKSIIKEVIRHETMGELSPNQLDMVEGLPSETGVYYMHDKKGDIIFLGKTKNLKKRVNQHFTNVGKLARSLQKETKKVTFEKTGSELIALLKEYEEVRKLRPRYNAVTKKKKLFTHRIFSEKNQDAYWYPVIDSVQRKAEGILSFNSYAGANNFLENLKEEHQLFANKTNGQGHEDVEAYNTRYNEAFAHYSLNNKTMAIIDQGRKIGEKSIVLIKNGQLIGIGYADLNYQINTFSILESILTPISGDDNTNHIIETYLRKHKRLQIINLKQEA